MTELAQIERPVCVIDFSLKIVQLTNFWADISKVSLDTVQVPLTFSISGSINDSNAYWSVFTQSRKVQYAGVIDVSLFFHLFIFFLVPFFFIL